MELRNQEIELTFRGKTAKAILTRKSRTKINIKVGVKGVIVSAPPNASMFEIDKVINNNLEWIFTNIEKYKKIEEHIPEIADDEIFFRGNFCKSIYTPAYGTRIIYDAADKVIYSGCKITQDKLIKWYKEQADFYIPARAKKLAEIKKLKINNVNTRVALRRWGSCNSKGNISLNSKLILTPDNVIDAIILHELAHTVHMNHGEKFWELLLLLCPWWEESERWLKNHNLLIQRIWNI